MTFFSNKLSFILQENKDQNILPPPSQPPVFQATKEKEIKMIPPCSFETPPPSHTVSSLSQMTGLEVLAYHSRRLGRRVPSWWPNVLLVRDKKASEHIERAHWLSYPSNKLFCLMITLILPSCNKKVVMIFRQIKVTDICNNR